MSLTVSVRTEYVNAKKLAFQQKHDRRERKRIPHYINPELSRLNECVIDKGISAKELLETNRAVRQKAVEEGRCPLKRIRSIKNTDAIAYRGIITWGTEAQKIINSLDGETQKKLYLEIARRISKEAEVPLLSLYIHRDEQAPHAHFTMNKFKRDGSTVNLKKQDLKRFQDIAGEVCGEFSLPISRGVPKEQRIAEGAPAWEYLHKTVRELHESLPKELEMKEQELKQIEADLKRRRDELDAVRREIEELEEARKKRLKDVEDKQRLIEKAKRQLEELAAAGRAESEKAQKLEKRISVYENRISTYEREISEKEQSLNEKNKELEGMMQALEVYGKLLAERKDKAEETEKLKAENERLKKALGEIKDGLIRFGANLNKELQNVKPNRREFFEETFSKAAEGVKSSAVDLLMEAFYGDIEAHYMRS